MKKVLLSIAGYDPTSGAGIILDLKVFQHLDFEGMAILTSVTSQNTIHVKKFHCIPSDFLWDQYKCLCEDVNFSGIKVGMVGCRNNIPIIERILSDNPDIPKVIDPVFKSSSGIWLLEKKAVSIYIKKIIGKASLLTPNLEEAALISGRKVENLSDMKEAAERIYSLTRVPCMIKGGHLPNQASDLLFDGTIFHLLKKEKITKKVHGTGCFFSSSLLGYLAKGKSLKKACSLASRLTFNAIKNAVSIGHGQAIITFPIKLKAQNSKLIFL